MWRQGIMKFAAVSALGLLVLIFAIILLAVLSPTLRPTHTDFVFAISRRTLNCSREPIGHSCGLDIFLCSRFASTQSNVTAVELKSLDAIRGSVFSHEAFVN